MRIKAWMRNLSNSELVTYFCENEDLTPLEKVLIHRLSIVEKMELSLPDPEKKEIPSGNSGN